MAITRIIVPVDGSAPAKRAAAMAGALAGAFGAAVVLVHVRSRYGADIVPEELLPLEQSEHVRITEATMLAAAAESILAEAEAALRKAGAARIARRAEIGDPVGRILDVARAEQGDLIVMGRRGLGRIGRLLLGSVSATTLQLADIPCLTVP